MIELLPHNLPTFSSAMSHLTTNGRVAIVQATGTGKTYNTMAIMEEFPDTKVLYVLPRRSMIDNIRLYPEWNETNVTFVTYLYLLSHNIDVSDTLVILDEFQYAGAPVWGKPIIDIMQNALYVVGLSATPIRHLDKGRDMAEELFKGNIVYGTSLKEAFELGIFKKFYYYAMISDVEDIIQKYNIPRARLGLYGYYELGIRIRKYWNKDNDKIIIFCSSIKQIEEVEPQVSFWFGEDVKVFKLHSKSNTNNVLHDFSEHKGVAAILCVDMLNVGVHVSGVSALVFLRKTNSPNLFEQQLGRGLSASKNAKNLQVFDVVGNYNNVSHMRQLCMWVSGVKENTKEAKEMFIVDDVLLSIEEVLGERNKPFVWETWMDAIIIDNYPTAGPSMYIMIPGVTKVQVSARAKELGVYYRKRWTPDEDLVILKYYPKEGKEVYKRLRGRTPQKCQSRASTLGVKFIGRWTIDEDIFLYQHYPYEGAQCFKELQQFTFDECMKRVRRLGL